jgi:signal transduction histidine kinase
MKKILVIEDDISVRDSIEQILEAENYDVILAENGRIGIEKAVKNLPDLIICDVMMPEIDGYGVITELHKNNSTNSIPFIFLTAKSEKNDIRTGMNLGADDYLNKPFTIAELLSAIETRLSKNETHEQKSESKLEELRYNISMALPHELNTPLTGIIGYTEMIQDYADEMDKKEILEFVGYIHEAAIRQKKLVDRILLYSHLQLLSSNKNEFNKLKDKTTPFSQKYLSSLLYDKITAAKRPIDLQVEIEDRERAMHPEYLEIIIAELADNCIKFTTGETQIKVTGKTEGDFYELVFADNGRGISNEQIGKIGAFMQFDRKKFEQQGAGLGLILVLQISKLFNASFNINSQPGNGTTVKIDIPFPIL